MALEINLTLLKSSKKSRIYQCNLLLQEAFVHQFQRRSKACSCGAQVPLESF